MKTKIQAKQFLVNTGFWYPLNFIRMIPNTLYWLRTGCSGYAPHPIKMMVVGAYLDKFSINQFIETGTCLGDTLGYIAKKGVRCTSIELSEELFNAACIRFKTDKNINLIQGDSGKKLPELLESIIEPALFWLDGHYSAGITVSGETHTPISTELQAILNHTIKKHVILIDDARCFDGTNDYPHLSDLLKVIHDEGNYTVEVSADIIRLVPNR